MSLPSTWAELLARLAAALGCEAEAEHWIREAVEACWGVGSLRDLNRAGRQVAFQRACGVLLALEEEGVPDHLDPPGAGTSWLLWRDGTLEPATGKPRRRARVAAVFARYWGGAVLEGPPWQLDPLEDRPGYEEWARSADFDAPTPSQQGAAVA